MKTFQTFKVFILPLLAVLVLAACSDDDTTVIDDGEPFVVAFETPSGNLSEIENDRDIALVYSETATNTGQVAITVASSNAVYGEDFTTVPAADGNTILLTINKGETGASVTFNKLNPSLDETVEIRFNISEVSYPNAQIQGNTSFTLNSSASLGRSFAPTVGGPNEQNQVYIDLSTEKQTTYQRDEWDLGFYSGSEFRVAINGSVYMAVAELESTDIDAVSSSDVADIQAAVAVGTFDPANEAYVDHPDGDINKTAISAISSNNADNKVYLLNLGFEVGTETPEPGSVAIAGDPRGYLKIRILRDGDAYLLQYAELDATTHTEVTIEKSPGYNFTFFSFNSNSVVNVAPESELWDLNFTVFTNLIDGAGSYGFSDGVLHNRKGGVVSYQVESDGYAEFTFDDVQAANFQQDQRAIGSNWRDVLEGTLTPDVFYIIQDPNGNIYKLRFLALTNDDGIRGYPEFEYELL